MRQPLRTRQALLEAGFWEVYGAGFRAARIETILAQAHVTKGAFYHHFPSKAALGIAVVEEIIRPMIEHRWLAPVRQAANPVDGLRAAARARERDDPEALLLGGCPLFNLLQDSPAEDDALHAHLVRLLDDWRGAFAAALARGQAVGHVREDLHADVSAAFLIASYHGVAGTARAGHSASSARRLLRAWATLVETLRAR